MAEGERVAALIVALFDDELQIARAAQRRKHRDGRDAR